MNRPVRKSLPLSALFVGALIGLVMVLPFIAGMQTEKKMQQFANHISQYPGYSAQWHNYQRSWRQSTGQLQVVLDLPGLNMSDSSPLFNVGFDVAFEHGPILLSEGLSVGWFAMAVVGIFDDALMADTVTALQPGDLYSLNARMNLSGTLIFSDQWLPATIKYSGATLTTKGYQGQGELTRAQKLDYSFTLPGIFYTNVELEHEANFTKIQSHLTADYAQLTPANVMPSQWRTEIEAFEAMDVAVDNMHFALDTDILNINTDALMNTTVVLQFESAAYAGEQWQNAKLALSYKNISLAFLERYQNTLGRAVTGGAVTGGAISSGAAITNGMPSQADLSQSIGQLAIDKLLPQSPVAAVDELSFESSLGRLTASNYLTVDGDAIAQAQLSPMNPFGFIPFIIARADISADTPLAEALAAIYLRRQIQQQLWRTSETMTQAEIEAAVEAQVPSVLHMLEMQNFVQANNNQYTSKLVFEKGEATLNGQPLPLPF